MLDQSDVTVIQYLSAVVFVIVLVTVSSLTTFKVADKFAKKYR